MTLILAWMLMLAKDYAFVVVLQTLLFRFILKTPFKTSLQAALKMYCFRYWTFARFLHEHTREARIAELDTHDLALIEANKEVQLLLEGPSEEAYAAMKDSH